VIDRPEMTEREMWDSLPHTDGEEKAALLLELCSQATYRNAGDEALALAESAKEIYDSLGGVAPNADIAKAYTGIGYSLKKLNRTKEAAQVLESAVTIYREDHYPFVDDLLRTQAIWYSEIGDWESTLRCHLEAVTINEVDGNDAWLARSLNAVKSALDWVVANRAKYNIVAVNVSQVRIFPGCVVPAGTSADVDALKSFNVPVIAATFFAFEPSAQAGYQGFLYYTTSENGSITATAPSGAIFTQVIFASYGNPTGSGPFTVGTCNSSSSVSYVSSQILNKNTYVIYANNTNFGDPCSGVSKNLSITLGYTYLPVNTYVPALSGNPTVGQVLSVLSLLLSSS
jgi:hypothetical protein